MGDSVGQIDLDLHVNQNGFNNQINSIAHNAQGVAGGAFLKLGGIIAGAFAVTKLVGFGKECINLASDLQEVQNVVDVTFGKMSKEIDRFSKTALQQFGLSELSAKRFASTMGAMLKSSGLAGTEMMKMSEGITGLAADMASFYNLDPTEAFDKIKSGMAGEIMPLRSLGINMSVANMEAYALSQGITTAYQKMDQASQSILRYKYLLSVTKDAQGDFARTSGSWANQVRLMGEQWNIFKTSMGAGFINMLTPVLKGLNFLILKLQVAAEYFRMFTEAIFGNASPQAKGAVITIQATEATDGLGASADGAAKATGKLGKAVKDTAAAIKGSLGSFDQLNVLTKDTADAADPDADGGDVGGVGGDVGGGPAIPAPKVPNGLTDGINALKKAFQELLAPLKAIDFGPLSRAFDGLLASIKPFTDIVFAGLKWFYLEVLVPIADWTIGKLLPSFLDVLAGCFDVLNPILKALAPLAQTLFRDFLVPIASWVGGHIIAILTDLGSILKDVGKWLSGLDWEAGFKGADQTWTAMKNIWGGVVKWMDDNLMKPLVNLFVGLFSRPQIESELSLTKVKAVWNSVATWFTTNVSTPTIACFTGMWAYAGAAPGNAMAKLKAVWTGIGSWFVSSISGPTIDCFQGLFAYVGAAPGNAMVKLKAVWSSVAGWFKSAVTAPTVTYFQGLWAYAAAAPANAWTKVKGAWVSVANWFKTSITNPIAVLFKGLWNTIIGGMNKVIAGLNKIHFTLPKIAGGGSFGISIPQIPKLANGGLVSAPTLAMVGDNRGASADPEVIAPLSKLKSMLGNQGGNEETIALLTKILSALNNQKGDAILRVGETEFARVAIKAINNAHRQAGQTLLNV